MRAGLTIVILTACHYTPPPRVEETFPDSGADVDAPAVDGPTIDSPAGLVCPQGFIDLGGSKYLIQNNSDEIKSWKNAETACAGLGTDIHLAVINSSAEADALAPMLSGSRFYWVGEFQPTGEAHVEDGWTGLDGNPTLDHWAFGNPDDNSNIIVSEDDFAQFAELDGNGDLHDDLGTASRFWVCECDGVPVPGGLAIP